MSICVMSVCVMSICVSIVCICINVIIWVWWNYRWCMIIMILIYLCMYTTMLEFTIVCVCWYHAYVIGICCSSTYMPCIHIMWWCRCIRMFRICIHLIYFLFLFLYFYFYIWMSMSIIYVGSARCYVYYIYIMIILWLHYKLIIWYNI